MRQLVTEGTQKLVESALALLRSVRPAATRQLIGKDPVGSARNISGSLDESCVVWSIQADSVGEVLHGAASTHCSRFGYPIGRTHPICTQSTDC